MSHLHNSCRVHRDIKPRKIMRFKNKYLLDEFIVGENLTKIKDIKNHHFDV